jgi:hypothetical protein
MQISHSSPLWLRFARAYYQVTYGFKQYKVDLLPDKNPMIWTSASQPKFLTPDLFASIFINPVIILR